MERREVTPVGASQPVPVDIRLNTATNRTDAELMREEIFARICCSESKPSTDSRRARTAGGIAVLLETLLAFYAAKPTHRDTPVTEHETG